MQDLNDLQYFAQVVRHGGFSAASRATGEPKAKLSKRVAQLERDLVVRLIERSTRSIRVTEIGRGVFAQCEVIVGGLEATEAIVARSRDEVRGSLRVSCPPQLPHILGPGPMTTCTPEAWVNCRRPIETVCAAMLRFATRVTLVRRCR